MSEYTAIDAMLDDPANDELDENACRVCGCTNTDPCVWKGNDGHTRGCIWVEDDLCSLCARGGEP